MAFTIKQSDTRPVYAVQLVDQSTGSNVPIDLTTATSVLFKMRTQGSTGSPLVSAAMTVTDAANGKVQYTFQTTDLATVGTYDVEFSITWNDGGVETVPNASYLTIVVVNDLDH